MTADRDKLRFYVDASALGLGKTLAAAREDTIHAGHKLIPECKPGTYDTEWIPVVAERNLIVIARDKRINRRPQELIVLRDAGLRVFNIGGKKDESTWQWLGRLVRHWDRVEDIIATRGPGPWYYTINQGTVREIVLPKP